MLIPLSCIALLAAAGANQSGLNSQPFSEQNLTDPSWEQVEKEVDEDIENDSEEDEEDEIADRSSKNSQEYNLYDREQNRGSNSQSQYYYYQNPSDNRGQSKKLYQRDDG